MVHKKGRRGICYLTGAGPGDLGLVTIKARECVEKADVLVCDYLSNAEILKWARPEAEIIFAGKKKGDHKLTQEEINALLVEKTSSGKCVVRLKGGDPLLFGRGGEEALALAQAGLKFEIVPGITSALAAPAYAGIPVTHRGHASQLTIFTGHEDPTKAGGSVDYGKMAAQPGTKVMLMGVERIGQVAAELIKHGAEAALPVALVRWGTTGGQQTIRGPLGKIAEIAAEANFSSPAVAIFGEVVNLRDSLNWFESRPLFGKRIVVTRARAQAGVLSAGLRALGADVLEIPVIRIEPPADLMEFGHLVQDSHGYDWIVFSSPNGVNAFFEMFYKIYDDAREIGGVKIAAIGPATAQRVKDYHLKVDLQPSKYVAEAVIREFQKQGTIENERILVVRPEVARDVLAAELSRLGAIVDEAVAYRTVPETADAGDAVERFKAEGADLVTFTSSSTVENFLARKLPMPPGIKTASIGPVTSETLRENGMKVDIESKQSDIQSFIGAICAWFTADPDGGN
jgi:uroporphyrinogen III methyltransferase/synthase